MDPKKDYRIPSDKFNTKVIGPGFMHTWCDIEEAIYFRKWLEDKSKGLIPCKHPEKYRMPFPGGKYVILR